MKKYFAIFLIISSFMLFTAPPNADAAGFFRGLFNSLFGTASPNPGRSDAKVTADVTAPTLSTFAIGTNGTTWTFTYSENVTATDDGDMCDGYAVTMSTAGALTFTYAGGTRGSTNAFTCTGSATVNSGENITAGLNYTKGTIADNATNPLDTITNKTTGFTNGSTQSSYAYFGKPTDGSADPSTNTLATGTYAWTTGRAAIVLVTGYEPTAFTVSGVAGSTNTCTRAGTALTVGSYSQIDMFVCPNLVSGTYAFTATYSRNVGYRRIVALEFGGVATSTPFDQEEDGTDTNPTQTTAATPTLSQANELVVACYSDTDNHNFTKGSGWSVANSADNAYDGTDHFCQYKVVAATTGVSSSITVNSTTDNTYMALIRTFK
jgi:hypothetical protein